MAKTNIEDATVIEAEVIDEIPVEENVVMVEKENILVRAMHGVKNVWHKTPKSVKIGVGALVAGGTALLLGGKLMENSLANACDEDEDEDESVDTDCENNDEANDSEEVAE